MNKKRTNCLVAIINIIYIVALFLLAFSANDLISSIISGGAVPKSIYDSIIIDILLNNIEIISILLNGGIGIINIICAIQNKENKKICFWQFVFGFEALFVAIPLDVKWIDQIIFSIVPIILASINLIRIRKNRPKVIQVISYIAVIIFSILSLLQIMDTYWPIIAVVMQLIYIHYQEKNIEESKTRKVINIILYYILQVILVIGFLGMVLSSLLIIKINENKWKSGLEELYNSMATMSGVTNKEIYIPVEKNYKYGFINERGQEIIPCEYDRVSYFNEIEINNNKFYVALAKKDTKFYIISKNNDVLVINNVLEKYLQTIYSYMFELENESMNEDYRTLYIVYFEFLFGVINEPKEIQLIAEILEANDETKEIVLTEQDSKYYCSNQNYSMLIEPIYDDSYSDEDMYYSSAYETKYKVTVLKSNGELQANIVYLPGFYEEDLILETFTNGYIEFEDETGNLRGWYDYNGNQVSILSDYSIRDIKDDKVILQIDSDYEDENYSINPKVESYFIIIDFTGKTLLQTTALDIYDNMYLVKNNNRKMVLLDQNLNVITKEYDKIITNDSVDFSTNYSSYY